MDTYSAWALQVSQIFAFQAEAGGLLAHILYLKLMNLNTCARYFNFLSILIFRYMYLRSLKNGSCI